MLNSPMFRCLAFSGLCFALVVFFVNPELVARQIEPKLVVWDVNAIEKNGQFVTDLTKDEFSIYEDGVKQQIDSFEAKDQPISLGLVVDSSGSMRDKLAMAQTTLATAISLLSQNDEAFIVQFKMDPELVETFTNDKAKLMHASSILFASGGTSLLDAAIATTDFAEEKGKYQRKALIFVTDGLEKNSTAKEKDVMTAIKEGRVQAYFIYLPTESDEAGSLFRPYAVANRKDLITRLAETSGGQAFFLSKMADAPSVAAGIIKNLHRQYRITYKSTNTKQDGDWRKLKVEIQPKPNRKLTIIARPGYFAPGYITEKEKRRQKQSDKK